MSTRRELITLLGGAGLLCVANARRARAQPAAMPVIGYVGPADAGGRGVPHFIAAFGEGLADAGYTEGKNVAIEYRGAEGHSERLPVLIVDLVPRQVAVIVVSGDVATLVAKGATSTIPIVFATGSDPVRSGLVASLNRPGGNATGATVIAGPLGAKRMELMREVLPKAGAIGILINPNNPNAEPETADVQAAARPIGQPIHVLRVASEAEIEQAFAALAQAKVGALLVSPDPLFLPSRQRFVALAARYAVPTIYYAREYADAGGLMSYGASFAGLYRQCGNYVGQILKGARPADLPVVQPTKFELVINLKTAKALGLDVPDTLLARADDVIE